MRVLGVDYGERRVGLALSDPSGTLARPWQVVPGHSRAEAAARAVAAALAAAERGDEPIGAIVVGLPKRLNGEPTDQTPRVLAFAEALGRLTGRPIVLVDERLTSHEADGLLAAGEPDWRVRKQKLDAAAAAVILQEYLDRGRRLAVGGAPDDRAPDEEVRGS